MAPRLLAALAAAAAATGAAAAPNGLARTPPRGWSSWNLFHRNISAALFTETADALVALGLRDAGYDRVNIDGGWWAGVDTGVVRRNASGFVQADPAKFPDGMAAVVDHVHARGLLWGHYTDGGTRACNGDAPMSEGYEAQDAAQFAAWGADMLKVDACAVHTADKQALMATWAALLNATGRPVLLSNCRNACMSAPGTPPALGWQPWCAALTNMWRTSGDINATWASMLANLDSLRGRGAVAGPGAWNDPDLLETGVGEFAWAANGSTAAANAAHFALWAVTSSPLILGFDVRPAAAPPAGLLALVTNTRALRINAEYAGNAGDVLATAPDGGEAWGKPLRGGAGAAVLLNRNAGGPPLDVALPLAAVPGLPPGAAACNVTDVWTGAPRGTVAAGGVYTAAGVPPRGAAFVLFDACT
jgi:alpha-galactosidase